MSEESNFISPTSGLHHAPLEPEDRSRLKKGSTGRKIFIVVILVGFLLLVLSSVGVARFTSGALQGKEELELAQEKAIAFEFKEAGDHLSEARAGFVKARSGLFFVRFAYPLPWVGDQLKAVGSVVDAGIESIDALDGALQIAAEIFEVVEEAQALIVAAKLPEGDYTFDSLPKETKRALLRTFHQSHSKLREMQVRLRLAQADLEELDQLKNVSPRIIEVIEPFRALMPKLVTGIDVMVPFAATISELAGVEEDKQWMVLFLNNTEMRPGGGFMGVFGLMLVRDGEIINLNVADTYSIDQFVQNNPDYKVNPPAPLRDYLGLDTWYFRDANWSPDFAQSSKDAIQLLRQEVAFAGQPPPVVHGVFGMTPDFAKAVLDIIGPQTVDGLTFDSNNFTDLLEFEVEFGFVDRNIAYDERKAIVGRLTDQMISKLFALPIDRWGEVFTAFNQAISEKQMAFYSINDDAQAAFEDAGWSGTVQPREGSDVFMIVDANMGALKTDKSVDRTVSYRIKKEGDDYIATAKIKYTHFGSFDLFTSRYRTFTRLYVPEGSELISHSGSLLNDKLSNPQLLPGKVVVQNELGLTSFGVFTSIEPGHEGELSFIYKLPQSVVQSIEDDIYELQLIKQMGAKNHALTLDLDFGKKVRAAQPSEDPKNFGDTSYHLNTIFNRDMVVTVQF